MERFSHTLEVLADAGSSSRATEAGEAKNKARDAKAKGEIGNYRQG
jgi:hypothetical protein